MNLKEYKFSGVVTFDRRWGYDLVITSFKNSDEREALVYVNITDECFETMIKKREEINLIQNMDMLEFIRKYDISKIRFASDLI